ncbi:MAG: hypothetical protein O3C19_01945 [Bacteroidetes bacterium]|nr:hypothetical protein [Bacteroidota bacterium]
MAEKKNARLRTVEVDTVDILAIDKSVYDWFNTKHALKIKGRKIPVIFGAWERFVQMHETKDDQTLNSLRDHKGMLKLPIISIKRGDISSNQERYKKARTDGEPSVKIIKKISDSSFDTTRRTPFNEKFIIGTNRYRKELPVYEIHRLPYPEFLNIPYIITFWSSYIKDANTFNNMLWPLHDLPDLDYKGFYFYAKIDTSSNESNTEVFSDEERIIKNSFNLEVQGYIFDKNQIIIERSATKIIFDNEFVEDSEVFVNENIDDIVARYNQGNDRTGINTLAEKTVYPL